MDLAVTAAELVAEDAHTADPAGTVTAVESEELPADDRDSAVSGPDKLS